MTEIKVFSKEWFKKYNKAITWVARLPILGELIFNFKKYGHYVDRKKVCEVTPNSVVEYLGMKGKKAELRQHFFVRNEYALRLQKVFYPIWITFHIWDIITRPIPQLNLGFDTLTQYPRTIGSYEPVDGPVGRFVDNSTWSQIRDGDGNFNKYETPNLSGYQTVSISNGITSGFQGMLRSIYCFDTSSLTSSSTISSAVLSLYGRSKSDNLSITPNINIYLATPSSTSSLSDSDYSQIGTTAQCDTPITYSGFDTSGYNDFTFNSTGKGNISKTGISKFGARNVNCDVDNSAPSYVGTYTNSNLRATFGDAESNKPKLVVTYTVPVTFIPRTMWFN